MLCIFLNRHFAIRVVMSDFHVAKSNRHIIPLTLIYLSFDTVDSSLLGILLPWLSWYSSRDSPCICCFVSSDSSEVLHGLLLSYKLLKHWYSPWFYLTSLCLIFISLFHSPICIFNWKSFLRLKHLDSTAFWTSPLNVPWYLKLIIYKSELLSYLNMPLLSTVYSSECYYSPCSHFNWKCGSYLRPLPCGSISKNSNNDNYDFNVTTI